MNFHKLVLKFLFLTTAILVGSQPLRAGKHHQLNTRANEQRGNPKKNVFHAAQVTQANQKQAARCAAQQGLTKAKHYTSQSIQGQRERALEAHALQRIQENFRDERRRGIERFLLMDTLATIFTAILREEPDATINEIIAHLQNTNEPEPAAAVEAIFQNRIFNENRLNPDFWPLCKHTPFRILFGTEGEDLSIANFRSLLFKPGPDNIRPDTDKLIQELLIHNGITIEQLINYIVEGFTINNQLTLLLSGLPQQIMTTLRTNSLRNFSMREIFVRTAAENFESNQQLQSVPPAVYWLTLNFKPLQQALLLKLIDLVSAEEGFLYRWILTPIVKKCVSIHFKLR